MGRDLGLWRRPIGSTTVRATVVALAGTSMLTACGGDQQADPCSLLTPAESSQILHTTPLTGKPHVYKVDKASFQFEHDGEIESHTCTYGNLTRLGIGVDITTFSSAQKAHAYAADRLKAKPAGFLRVSPTAAIDGGISGILAGTAIDDRRVLSVMAMDGRDVDSDGVAHPDFDFDLYRHVFKRASQDF
jgi:hypothetical protein